MPRELDDPITEDDPALSRGMELAALPMWQVPFIALHFAKHLCNQIGICGEVMIIAYTCYAQAIELYRVLLQCDQLGVNNGRVIMNRKNSHFLNAMKVAKPELSQPDEIGAYSPELQKTMGEFLIEWGTALIESKQDFGTGESKRNWAIELDRALIEPEFTANDDNYYCIHFIAAARIVYPKILYDGYFKRVEFYQYWGRCLIGE